MTVRIVEEYLLLGWTGELLGYSTDLAGLSMVYKTNIEVS